MLLLASLASAAAVALIAAVVLARAQERAAARAALRPLQSYDLGVVTDLRQRALMQSLRTRVGLPVLETVTALGRRLTPLGYAESARRKLVAAGRGQAAQLDRYLALRAATVALVPVWFLVAFAVLPAGGGALLVALLLSAVSVLGPDAVLDRKVEERRAAIRAKLADVLDLLTISVEAGLGFEQALDRTVAAVPGPLSDEFRRLLGETRAGASRADALRALVERVDVAELRSFVLALLQADAFGISIGRILRAQADEMRVKRRQLAQERAQKAPVKMLIPMVFCIFPALFVVLIGPAFLNIRHSF